MRFSLSIKDRVKRWQYHKSEAAWRAYKEARAAEQKALKEYLRTGVLFWDSTHVGTYRKLECAVHA